MESEYAENCGDATAIGAAMKMRVFGAGRDTVTTTVSLHTRFKIPARPRLLEKHAYKPAPVRPSTPLYHPPT